MSLFSVGGSFSGLFCHGGNCGGCWSGSGGRCINCDGIAIDKFSNTKTISQSSLLLNTAGHRAPLPLNSWPLKTGYAIGL